MQIKVWGSVAACAIVPAGILFGAAWKPFGNPALAQATRSQAHLLEGGQWVRLNDYSTEPPLPVWINLERADTIRFYTGGFDTRQNVPQSVVSLGRGAVQVNNPHEIALLRRYVQQHQMRQ